MGLDGGGKIRSEKRFGQPRAQCDAGANSGKTRRRTTAAEFVELRFRCADQELCQRKGILLPHLLFDDAAGAESNSRDRRAIRAGP